MSKRTNKPQSRPVTQPGPDLPDNISGEDITGEDSSWAPTKNALLQILDGLASLRLTVALLAMAIFIVLAGTLGQVHRDIWDVVHDYFRMTPESGMAVTWTIPLINKEVILSTPVTWIDLNIFFPPAFSSDGTPPDLSTMTAPARLWSSMLMGFGWSALIWLIPFRDRKFQLVFYGGARGHAVFAHREIRRVLVPQRLDDRRGDGRQPVRGPSHPVQNSILRHQALGRRGRDRLGHSRDLRRHHERLQQRRRP